MSAREVILDILGKAYQIEIDGYTFYSMTAEKAEKPAVRELFDKLAHDEVEHKAYLRDIMRNYDEKGSAAFLVQKKTPELLAFTQKIFTDRFREQAQGAAFETAALSIGMTLESNAIAYFTRASTETSEKEVKDFYRFLADWEKQHLDALDALFNTVRMDFWSQSGFAPF
ncbi:MAG: ferritin family protein [Acidobacteriota bacterium]